MARINNYIKDDIVEPTDIVIGTEKSTGKTKNYSIDSIRNFFVTETNVGGVIFKKGNHLVSGEFTANSNYFSGVTEFKFNKTNTQGDSVIPIFNTLKTNLVNNRFTINVEDSTNQNRFILAKILNIIDNDTFFTITLDIVKNVGNGELVTGNNFSIEVGLYTEAIDGTKITNVTSNKVGNKTTVTVNGDFDNAPLVFEILDGDATTGVDWSNLLNIPISFPPSAHTHQISDVTSLQSNLDGKVGKNANIVAGTKTKITYDVKGLVTAGADATTADIADSLNKRYVTDADLVDIGNLSGVNTGDQNLSGYELLSNKQNSLVVDGSGIKYPTVDAVNAGIAGVNTNKVPYTGATTNVNLGSNSLTAFSLTGNYVYANVLLQLPNLGYITVNGNGADYFKGTRGQQWTSDIKIKYATDLSGSYDSRTLIDKGYLDTRLGSTGTGFELTSNKVTSLSGASTDVQYPSAKLTYDQLALKENVANKQNSLTFDGTGVKYPTVDAITAPNIPAARLGNSTFTSVQHIQDLFHSAGWTSGGVITNAGGGLITVSAGTGLIRATNSDVATIYFTDFAASIPANVVLVDGSQNYIYVEYNAGAPRVIATTIQRADYNTNFLIGAVYRVGTTLHINSTVKTAISDHAGKMIAFNKEVMPYARANGSMISEVATRGFAITAGTFWNGLVRFTTNAFSTATGSFFYFYRNGVGGWTKVPTQTQINNTQFDNGTGALATLSNNKYGIHWVFIDTDGDTYVVYGQGDYTLIEAQNKMVPSSLPVEITSHGFVVGKIIIQKSLTTFAQIESAFAMGFSSAMASEHNSLAGLQGGAAGDYQHLTATQATIATQEATNTLSGYVSAGTQTFGGVKTFTLSPIVPTPTTNTQVTNKSYVDAKVADTITDGVTTIAPSQNAVFDALALKEPANANIQTHISSTSNPHSVTKTQVGLSNVDNVQQIPLSQKGAINGVAELDAQGFVKNTQLPSYVDDVIEGTLATFPATGETGKIYVDTVTNKTYRWSGTVYTVISETIALGETDSTAYRGDRGKLAYDHSQLTHDKTFVGLGNVDNTSDASKPVSTATQTALDGKVDENAAITGGTKTKITYDIKGLVTAGADATTADIADSLNKRYVTDADLVDIGNLSGINRGDQTSIVGITGTKAQFDTAVTDGNFMYVGDKVADSELLDGIDSLGFIRMYPNLIGYDVNSWSTAKRGWSNAFSTAWTNVPLGSNNATALYEHSFGDENYGFQQYVRSDGGASLETYVRNRNTGGTFSSWYKILHTGNFIAGTNYQTPITNPITGTGTINYIPKFTGAGSLGNSLIFDNGTNVGIGTVSPEAMLHINTFGVAFTIGNTGATAKQLIIRYDSDNNYAVIQAVHQNTGFRPILLNPNGGNVLIGTTTDNGAKLQVSGSIKISTGDQTFTRLNLNNTSSTGNRTFSLIGGIQAVGQDGFSIYDNIADATRLVIANNGNVGIGYSTGTEITNNKLAVNGSGYFNGSVTATAFQVGNGQYYKATRSSGSLVTDMIGIPSGTDNVRILTTDAFNVVNGSLTTILGLTNAGAATFSGNVTAIDYLFSGDETYKIIRGGVAGGAIQFGLSSSTFNRDLRLGFVSNGLDFTSVLTLSNQTSNATFVGSVTATEFIGSSDITLKENIQVLQPKKINSNYKTFNFIGSEQQRVGVLAQELELEHPEFIRTDEKGMKSVSYSDLHSAEIAYLKDKIERLEELVHKLMM